MPRIQSTIEFGVIAQVRHFAKFAQKLALQIVDADQVIGGGTTNGELIAWQRDDLSGFLNVEVSEGRPISGVDADRIATEVGDIDSARCIDIQRVR